MHDCLLHRRFDLGTGKGRGIAPAASAVGYRQPTALLAAGTIEGTLRLTKPSNVGPTQVVKRLLVRHAEI